MESPPSSLDCPPLHLHILTEFRPYQLKSPTLSDSTTDLRLSGKPSHAKDVRCQVRVHLDLTCHTSCPPHGNAYLEPSPAHSHTTTLSLVHPSLSTLSHTLKQERGREGEVKEGRIGATVAREGLGDHLEALIHKRLGFVEGGALSPSP